MKKKNKKNSLALSILSSSKGYVISTICLLALLITVDSVIMGVDMIKNTFNTVFGDERRVVVSGDASSIKDYYTCDDGITDKKSALKNANNVNELIGEEGFTLLKNDSSLPLKSSAKVSVYGMNSVNLVYSGSGSSAKSNSDGIDLYSSLTMADIAFNPELKDFYSNKKQAGKGRPASPTFGDIPEGFATGELALSEYSSTSPTAMAGQYTDAAIVVISRIGGEGYDLPRTMKGVDGANQTDHYLRLDNNEKALLNNLCSPSSPFSNVILVVNSGSTMELGFVDNPIYNNKIKSVLWIGNPGGYGMSAFGKILNGTVNPSGRTVDTYAKDLTLAPSYKNFGTNFKEDGNTYYVDGVKSNYHFVDYEEGIYIGYKYYETRGYTEKQSGNGDWYSENVQYPFGYGLSYADFSWTLKEFRFDGSAVNTPLITSADADKKVEIIINVKNNSTVYSGKDVVELYSSAPYNISGIEKSKVNLVDFTKTKVLNPGESQDVAVTTTLRQLASYDYNDANDDQHKGYELESGNYSLLLGKNAHQAWDDEAGLSCTFNIKDTIHYDTDETTGKQITNLFDDVSDHITTYLSRSNWDATFPSTPTNEDLEVSQNLIDSMSTDSYLGTGSDTDKGKPWYSEKSPRQQRAELSYENATVKLCDLIGADYSDTLWDTLLNQLTLKQMRYLIGTGNFNTAAIENIGKPKTTDLDGPSGFTNFMSMIEGTAVVYDTAFYASECLIGATYNKEIAYKVGNAIGNEGLIGNQRGDKRLYSGWYAPAVNLHRSPFSGRNWEYYSEDGIINGIMAAQTIQGAKEKGVYTFVKHFALNDQETHRDSYGLATWANEQCMRELYLKPFEMAVKDGGATAMMSSFNRIGNVWAGGNYSLLTSLLREQWGFKGMVITDYNTHPEYMDPDQMIRAGGDLNLFQDLQPSTSGSRVNATHRAALRRATKNILYTVTNSCAMNGLAKGVRYGYAMPYWTIVLISANCVAVTGLGVWGFFSIRKSVKKYKSDKEVE